MSNLIKYKSPIESSFHLWINDYPTSKYWKERIKKCPDVKGCPNIQQFYKFVKTVNQQGNTKKWKDWNYVEEKILEYKPNFSKSELKILKNKFNDLMEFHKTPPLKKGLHMERDVNVKTGYYLECKIENRKFVKKELSRKTLN